MTGPWCTFAQDASLRPLWLETGQGAGAMPWGPFVWAAGVALLLGIVVWGLVARAAYQRRHAHRLAFARLARSLGVDRAEQAECLEASRQSGQIPATALLISDHALAEVLGEAGPTGQTQGRGRATKASGGR